MFGATDSEYIRLKHSSCGVIFEATFLLLHEHCREAYSYEWNLKYNMFNYNIKRWCATLNFINRNGFNDKIIRHAMQQL